MLDKLGDTLKKTMSRIAGAVFIDKKIIDDILKDLKYSLLEADVDTKIVFSLCDKIRKKAGEKVAGLDKKEQIIKLIHDELVEILGKEEHEIKIDKTKKPFKIMLLGLYGGGKTTTAAKLGFYYSKRGLKTCLVGLDVHRPAAPEQLEQMALKAKLPYFIDKQEKLAGKIWKNFEEKLKKYDLAIIDTAGRDVLSNALINELNSLHREIKPDLVILIMPADIGKAASSQAQGFAKACKIDGVIVTRLDGTAKGGGALASCSETGAKVLFIGTGEKLQDIETFDPRSFVSRLLGMGDLRALLEKAKLAIEEKEKKKIESRLQEGKFTLNDLYDQIKAMQSMGPLNKIAEMIPGLGGLKAKIPSVFDVQEAKLKRWRFAIDSMTPTERENPEILSSSRIARISKGSNVPTNEIRELIKQYKIVKELVSEAKSAGLGGIGAGQIDRKTLQKLAKKFGRRLM
ncbi:MAG: signal recognition particle receptor subunit alpha [Candidatus Pacearchaeota archaeon]|nr:signal recognition particle receptor subunit alpha [Candidatus Pacearchaeota archaeon]